MDSQIRKNLIALVNGETGNYVLPFKISIDGIKERNSNVVYVSSDDSRMLAIIEELEDGSYQDWYYNEMEKRFKPLTCNSGDDYYDLTFRESWMEEEMDDRLPEPFRNYVPKPINWGDTEDISE